MHHPYTLIAFSLPSLLPFLLSSLLIPPSPIQAATLDDLPLGLLQHIVNTTFVPPITDVYRSTPLPNQGLRLKTLSQLSDTTKTFYAASSLHYKQMVLDELSHNTSFNDSYTMLNDPDRSVQWKGVYNCLKQPEPEISLKEIWDQYGSTVRPIRSPTGNQEILLIAFDVTINEFEDDDERKQKHMDQYEVLKKTILQQVSPRLLSMLKTRLEMFFPGYLFNEDRLVGIIQRTYQWFGKDVANASWIKELVCSLDCSGFLRNYFFSTERLERAGKQYYYAAKVLLLKLEMMSTTKNFVDLVFDYHYDFILRGLVMDAAGPLMVHIPDDDDDSGAMYGWLVYENFQSRFLEHNDRHHVKDLMDLRGSTRGMLQIDTQYHEEQRYASVRLKLSILNQADKSWISLSGETAIEFIWLDISVDEMYKRLRDVTVLLRSGYIHPNSYAEISNAWLLTDIHPALYNRTLNAHGFGPGVSMGMEVNASDIKWQQNWVRMLNATAFRECAESFVH